MDKDKKQNMSCKDCKQKAIMCSKCIRKIMEYWEVEDYFISE